MLFQTVSEIEHLIGSEDVHADARATTVIVPSPKLPTVALPVVEIGTLVESAEYAIESYADRMQYLMGLADHAAESSPFQQWLAENGADLEFDDSGNPTRMRIDTILSRLKADSFENVATIASEALEKWSKSGNDPTILRSAQLTWKAPGGGRETGFVGAVADR